MQRQAVMVLATALILGSNAALAQSGDLAGVTMRVLDDLRDVDAVVLELDANRGEAPDGAAADAGRDARGRATRDAVADGDEPREAAATEPEERSRDVVAREAAAQAERLAQRRERNQLHDVDADERAEGRLEDRDLERSTQPPPPAPAP